MDAAILYRWGASYPGKLEESVALFAEAVKYLDESKAAGLIASYEPFLFSDGDFAEEMGAIFVLGPEADIQRFMMAERTQAINAKAMQVLNHYQIHYLLTGAAVAARLQQIVATVKEPQLVH